MAIRLHHVTCPNCGAPIGIREGLLVAICIFCNASLRVEPTSSTGPTPTLAAGNVPPEAIERVKQLLLDGQREVAVDHYAEVAGVPRPDAEAAVDQVFLGSYFQLVRHCPIALVGVFAYLGLAGLGAAVALLAGAAAPESPALWLVVALGSAFGLRRLWSLARHLRSTFVCSFGSRGRGRILKSAVVRSIPKRETNIAVVVFEVTPDDGTPPFVDQETLMLGARSTELLVAGNTVRVRFDRGRALVFPSTPVEVL